MSSWRSGSFDRNRLHPVYHAFAPAHAAENLPSIDLKKLWNEGKRLLLLDVDNTIVQWKGENFSQPVLDWVAEAKAMGFEICIISNTRRVTRLARLSEMLGVQTVRGRFKPSRAMFRLALIKFGRKREEAVMIGDQMMTDILGANRAGIEAIWVRKMEGREFSGTRINRFVEGILAGAIYKSLVTPVDEKPGSPEDEAAKPIAERTIVHQIVKFAIVGGSSFVIDYCVRMTLLYGIHVRGEEFGVVFGRSLTDALPFLHSIVKEPQEAAYPFAAVVAAGVAMINSFFLNRAWTFQIRGKEERTSQMRRFFAVAIAGAALNVLLSTGFNIAIPGDSKTSARIATILASLIVAVWNFIGQRRYAFRQKAQ